MGASDKAQKNKAKYTKQRMDAQARYSKTGVKDDTYKSLERKGYVKDNNSERPGASKSKGQSTPGNSANTGTKETTLGNMKKKIDDFGTAIGWMKDMDKKPKKVGNIGPY